MWRGEKRRDTGLAECAGGACGSLSRPSQNREDESVLPGAHCVRLKPASRSSGSGLGFVCDCLPVFRQWLSPHVSYTAARPRRVLTAFPRCGFWPKRALQPLVGGQTLPGWEAKSRNEYLRDSCQVSENYLVRRTGRGIGRKPYYWKCGGVPNIGMWKNARLFAMLQSGSGFCWA